MYVIPRGAIKTDTAVSLNNEKLNSYKNNWDLLAQPIGKTSGPIEWKPKIPDTPKEIPLAIIQTMRAAATNGLLVERPHLASEYQLYISYKRCQIVQAKPVVTMIADQRRLFVPLNVPRSDWAEFLVFFIRADATTTTGDFYVIPRAKVTKRTVVSPISSWLKEYADAWHLLGSEKTDSMSLYSES